MLFRSGVGGAEVTVLAPVAAEGAAHTGETPGRTHTQTDMFFKDRRDIQTDRQLNVIKHGRDRHTLLNRQTPGLIDTQTHY